MNSPGGQSNDSPGGQSNGEVSHAAAASEGKPIRVVVADDHPFYRHGLADLLAKLGIEVVGEAATGAAAIELVERTKPDVLVLDLNMPQMSGIEVCRHLLEADAATRVLMVSVSAQESDVDASIRAGAIGYILKDEAVDEVVAGIRAAVAGESRVSPRIASMLLRSVRDRAVLEGDALEEVLSQRESQVLALVADGKTNGEIGAALFIDPSTVRGHISSILGKLEVDNRVQAAVRAVREGMV